jgi:NADP-dependent 3-hydroxy acid dehydrogenase YdfG
MSSIKNARVMVTGGSAGLGRAIVEALLARGAEVTAVARHRARLDEVERLGAKAIAGDVTDAGSMDGIVKERAPSVLVLNAGARLQMGPIDMLSFERFSADWNMDVKAGLHGIQAALRRRLHPVRVF